MCVVIEPKIKCLRSSLLFTWEKLISKKIAIKHVLKWITKLYILLDRSIWHLHVADCFPARCADIHQSKSGLCIEINHPHASRRNHSASLGKPPCTCMKALVRSPSMRAYFHGKNFGAMRGCPRNIQVTVSSPGGKKDIVKDLV